MNERLQSLTARRRFPTLAFLALVVGASTTPSAFADFPRTSDGKPDFSGYYDIATLTPLQRPTEYGDSLFLTPERAKEIAAAEAARMAQGNEDKDPDRDAPPEGGDGSRGAAGNVGGYDSFWIDRGEGAALVDGKFRTSIITSPANGRMPPMTEAAQAARAERFAGRANRPSQNEGTAWWVHVGDGSGPYDNPEQRPMAERCIIGFGPTSPILPTLYNNHKRIVQTPDSVMILNEMVHDVRIARMNGTHAPPEMKRWLGDAIAWWEDETLVIETTNFLPRGNRGRSADYVLTERLSATDDGQLLYAFNVTDPETWTDTWGGEYVWPRSQEPVYEYACHEGNYSFGNIMRGARRLEADAMAGSSGED